MTNPTHRVEVLETLAHSLAETLLDPDVADVAERNALRQDAFERLSQVIEALAHLAVAAESFAETVVTCGDLMHPPAEDHAGSTPTPGEPPKTGCQ